MVITLEKVAEAIRKAYGWDDSPYLYIKLEREGQVPSTGEGDVIDYLTVDDGQIILDVNEKGEVYGMELLP